MEDGATAPPAAKRSRMTSIAEISDDAAEHFFQSQVVVDMVHLECRPTRPFFALLDGKYV